MCQTTVHHCLPVLMNIIPAKVAGVKELCVPLLKGWKCFSYNLRLRRLQALTEYSDWRRQAIAAMAYSTESVPRVLR